MTTSIHYELRDSAGINSYRPERPTDYSGPNNDIYGHIETTKHAARLGLRNYKIVRIKVEEQTIYTSLAYTQEPDIHDDPACHRADGTEIDPFETDAPHQV